MPPDLEAAAFDAMLGDPDRHLEGLLGLAGLQISRGRFGEALRLADRARRLVPEDPIVAELRAALWLRLGASAAEASAHVDGAPPARAAEEAHGSVLLLTHARGGGVEHHVTSRIRALMADGLGVVELRPAVTARATGDCRLVVNGDSRNARSWRLPTDFVALAGVLRDLGVKRVEIHHTTGLDPSVFDLVTRLAAPYDVVVHDYSWICPRITLIAEGADYCGEPDLAACEACVRANGSLTREAITVADLRKRSARLMVGAARVIVPTDDVAHRLARYFPSVVPVVLPWEPEPQAMPAAWRSPAEGPIRIALLGAIGQHKGYDRLLACARDARARGLPLTFVVIGYTEDDPPLFDTGRVFVTGRYDEAEVPALLAREACDVALVASTWPETWCYTLTHLLRAGMPIVAFDLGAMRERLAGLERATLLPLETGAAALNDALLAAAAPRVRVTVARAASTPAGPAGWITRLRMEIIGVGLRGALDYSAVAAGDVATPWTTDGDWCEVSGGTRPLLGVAVRATSELARNRDCRCACVFSSGLQAEATDGEVCRSPWPNDPLVEVSVDLGPRP